MNDDHTRDMQDPLYRADFWEQTAKIQRDQLTAARDENARLRAELETANLQIDSRRIELLKVNERHEDIISRVRAVIDGWHGESTVPADAIRDALRGESE